ncbi:MAG: DUF1080 domain-containing protein [Phycisphaerae bacterium]|nr:DUF1080 domain-containing protein [Phycisphaerae bacterium]
MTSSLLCLLVVLNTGALAADLSEAEAKEGFVSLFNGKDLTGWVYEGKPDKAFLVKDGELFCNPVRGAPTANYPAWLRTQKQYENFILRFDYKIPFYCESGLAIHAPLYGQRSKVGIKIVLTEDTARGAKTQHAGSILGVAREKKMVATKHTTWYPMEVAMDYPMLRVKLNGELVQEIDCEKNEQLRYRLRSGYIGLTAMGSPCTFRNIRIKELPSKEKWIHLLTTIPGIDSKDKWIELKPGTNLGGWNILGKGVQWWVRDGVLRAAGDGYLITDGQWQDFELFTYIKATPHANGGIFFRWKGLNTNDRAYEIQIYNNPEGDNPTGSIYSYVRNPNLRLSDNEWFPMQIIARGKTVITRVNGDDAVFSDACTEFVRPGRIVLQMHHRGSQIEWKDLRIKPLK